MPEPNKDKWSIWTRGDSTVFKECSFGKKLYAEKLNLPAPACLPSTTNNPQPFVLIGDEAFGLHKNMLRPYPGRGLTPARRVFNYRLSRARRLVKCAFSILSNKLRILHSPILVEPNYIDDIIKACCILHNYVHRRDGYKFENTLSNPLEDFENDSAVGARHQGIKKKRRKLVLVDKSKLTVDKKQVNTMKFTNDKEQLLGNMESSDSVIILDDSDATDSTSCSSNPRVANNYGRKRTNRNNQLPPNARVLGSVICVGDFCDGYDMPQPLIKPVGKKKDEDTECAKEEEEKFLIAKLNREVSVKVDWRKMGVHRFPLRRFQPIKSIYEHFAKIENIEVSEVLLRLNNKRLSPSDTPSSIEYKFTEFIDGDIEFYRSPFNSSVTEEQPENDDEVKFKIKQRDVKLPLFISIKKTDQMAVLYIKISEKLGLDINSFTLEFDGDKIDKYETMESLDLVGDECLELFKKEN